MRYVRHLCALAAVVGFVGVGAAHAAPPPSPPPGGDENAPATLAPDQAMAPNGNVTAPPSANPPPVQCCSEQAAPAQVPPVIVVQPVTPPPVVVVMPEHRRHRRGESKVFSPYQMSLMVGGGASDFVFDRMASAVQTGAAWDARLTIGTRTILAMEVGYLGTLNRLEGPQSNEPYLMSNGVDSDLRINLLPWRVEPYIFGGVGYNHMSIGNRDSDPAMAARFRTSDDQFMVPAGAGLSGYIGRHATLDARFTYRAIINQNIMVENPGERADQWTALGRLGYAF